MFTRKTPFISNRGVHLDLKGMPPTPSRLLEILDILKKLRVNILLAEYNGMYPWSNKSYRFKTHYSLKNIKDFLVKAEDSGIKVIPLIQSLGHMEMILGLPENRKYRERKNNPAELCPLKNKAIDLVKNMIDEIFSTHAGKVEYFHLGGDEAWNFGSCRKCRKFINENSKSELFLFYYESLLNKVTAAGVRPMLWADMMREWPLNDLKEIGKKTDLIEWSYSTAPFARYRSGIIPENYKKAGIQLWGASAFKGADGSMANRPDLNNRIENNSIWTAAARQYSLKGIIATGWSRYSDYTAQCESLEASLDALILCASVMWDGKGSEAPDIKVLQYIRNSMDDSEKIEKIISISKELDKWFRTLHPHIDNFCRHYIYNSEPERVNEWEYYKDKKYFANFIRKIEKDILPEWKRLHKNLVSDHWTGIYVKSRISYLKKIYSYLCENK